MEIKKVYNQANKIMSDRRSIKKYDPSVKISREEITNILQDALTAPSSFNLQPWRFVVIDTEEGKKSIEPYMMFNKKQWETSSAIIAIFADLENASTGKEIYTSAYQNKLMDESTKDQIIEMISIYSKKRSKEQNTHTAVFDCGLVTMQIMLSAKNYGYDTNAIGGFEREETAKALDIDTSRYLPLLLLTIGKADEEGHDSICYSVDEITQWR